jgi:hypothetical protein
MATSAVPSSEALSETKTFKWAFWDPRELRHELIRSASFNAGTTTVIAH